MMRSWGLDEPQPASPRIMNPTTMQNVRLTVTSLIVCCKQQACRCQSAPQLFLAAFGLGVLVGSTLGPGGPTALLYFRGRPESYSAPSLVSLFRSCRYADSASRHGRIGGRPSDS